LFALAIWALANDVFTMPEAKRLFPLLGLAGLIGGIIGNGLAAGLARLTAVNPLTAFAGPVNINFDLLFVQASNSNYNLMLLNAALMGVSAGVLAIGLRHITIVVHQSKSQDSPIEILREGIAFVRDIPAFRYLGIVMLLVGIGLNTIEYQLVVSAAQSFQLESELSAFYGTFRMVRMISLLAVQGLLATWILKHVGLKSVFAFLPTVMFLALFLPILIPGVLMIAAGEYLVRIAMEGVDDPARRVFIGMVPDEQRGRVSAFFDGYLYPIGAVLSCLLIAIVLVLEQQSILPSGWAQPIYLSLIAVIVATSLYFITKLYTTYDQSMLNWRLRRRKRSSQLTQLDL
jgi:ATP/ADP translocase